MTILIREFQSPDEEMKKIVLKVVKQCVATDGVEAAYVKESILPEFFRHFWVRRMALDRYQSPPFPSHPFRIHTYTTTIAKTQLQASGGDDGGDREQGRVRGGDRASGGGSQGRVGAVQEDGDGDGRERGAEPRRCRPRRAPRGLSACMRVCMYVSQVLSCNLYVVVYRSNWWMAYSMRSKSKYRMIRK